MGGWVMAESLHLVMDQWIQYKLGKQYLLKKITLPWESNPGPIPIRGEYTITPLRQEIQIALKILSTVILKYGQVDFSKASETI